MDCPPLFLSHHSPAPSLLRSVIQTHEDRPQVSQEVCLLSFHRLVSSSTSYPTYHPHPFRLVACYSLLPSFSMSPSIPKTMQALRYEGPKNYSIVQVPVPEIGDDYILVPCVLGHWLYVLLSNTRSRSRRAAFAEQ